MLGLYKVALYFGLFCIVFIVVVYLGTRVGVKRYLPLKATGNTIKQLNWVVYNLKTLESIYKYKELNMLRGRIEKVIEYDDVLDEEIIKAIEEIIKPFIVSNKRIRMSLDNIKHLL